MSLTKTIKTAFEVVSGIVSTAAGESYTTGKESASYITTAISAKTGNKK